MKRILFLDIDGVLNYRHFFDNWKRRIQKLLHIKSKYRTEKDMISRYALFLVGILCKIKKYKVVLSSSWRYNWDENGRPIDKNMIPVHKLLHKYGVDIIGTTPIGESFLNKEYSMGDCRSYSVDSILSKKEYWRGTQILKYIENHNLNIDDCLIIDDDVYDVECYDCLKPRLIGTSYYDSIGGFRLKHLIKALKL